MVSDDTESGELGQSTSEAGAGPRKEPADSPPGSPDRQRQDSLTPLQAEPGDIAAKLEQEADRQVRRPALDVALSGLVGGLDVGFAPLGLAFVATHVSTLVGDETAFLIGALAYPIGFIFVILGRSQLFTESTLVPAVAVLSRTSGIRWLARQWGLVLGANLIGALLFALLVTSNGPIAAKYGPSIVRSTAELLSFSFGSVFLSGLLAGWVMALLSWLLAVADSGLARIVFVWIATFLIGAAPLHHSVSGAAEVMMAVMLGGAGWGDWLMGFQIPATLGNAVGGVLLVGVLKYLQAKAGGPSTPFG